MNKFFKKIDELIEKIPFEIRDIIQKMSIAFASLITLIGVATAIIQGTKDAKPSGFQVVEESNDLFYMDQLKQENRKNIYLIEDVEHDIKSLTEKSLNNRKLYKRIGRDTLDHLRGERDELIPPVYQDEIRSKRMVPGLLDNEEKENLQIRPPRDFSELNNNTRTNNLRDVMPESDTVSQSPDNKYNKKNKIMDNNILKKKMSNKKLEFLE